MGLERHAHWVVPQYDECDGQMGRQAYVDNITTSYLPP